MVRKLVHDHQYSLYSLLAPIPEYEMEVIKLLEEDDDRIDVLLPVYFQKAIEGNWYFDMGTPKCEFCSSQYAKK